MYVVRSLNRQTHIHTNKLTRIYIFNQVHFEMSATNCGPGRLVFKIIFGKSSVDRIPTENIFLNFVLLREKFKV